MEIYGHWGNTDKGIFSEDGRTREGDKEPGQLAHQTVKPPMAGRMKLCQWPRLRFTAN